MINGNNKTLFEISISNLDKLRKQLNLSFCLESGFGRVNESSFKNFDEFRIEINCAQLTWT
jgi:hypothetical protein